MKIKKQNFENAMAKFSNKVIDSAKLNDLKGGNGHGHPPPSN